MSSPTAFDDILLAALNATYRQGMYGTQTEDARADAAKRKLFEAAGELERQRDALREAARGLRRFADHRGGCRFIDGPAGSECSCGLAEALDASAKAGA